MCVGGCWEEHKEQGGVGGVVWHSILMSHTGRDLLRNFPAGRGGQVCI